MTRAIFLLRETAIIFLISVEEFKIKIEKMQICRFKLFYLVAILVIRKIW